MRAKHRPSAPATVTSGGSTLIMMGVQSLLFLTASATMASAGLVPGRYVSFLNQPWPASCKVGPDPLPDFAKFRISTNGPNATFLGSVCSTIYSFGDFPMYLGMGPGGACADGDWNCTKAHAVFGGLPQLTNLTKHLAKVQADIEQLFPDPEWDGVANVDWEAWKPIYKANRYNEYWIYINRSLTLAEQQHPTYTRAQIEATAEKDYNAAAQNFWLSSLRLAKKLRPKGTWGCPSDFCRSNALHCTATALDPHSC